VRFFEFESGQMPAVSGVLLGFSGAVCWCDAHLAARGCRPRRRTTCSPGRASTACVLAAGDVAGGASCAGGVWERGAPELGSRSPVGAGRTGGVRSMLHTAVAEEVPGGAAMDAGLPVPAPAAEEAGHTEEYHRTRDVLGGSSLAASSRAVAGG
jgi:hypothetical protein